MEASGDVGTLSFLFEAMGVHGWRDMSEDDLTEEGMMQGVYDSEVFVLFLTNSALSREFCQKELGWAIEFGKPVIIVVEREERFWAWDLQRWQADMCERDKTTWPHSWKKGWLQHAYASVPQPIKDLIEGAAAAEGTMLPFRRRDFEVNALVREIVRRANSQVWGLQMPRDAAVANAQAARTVHFIGADDARALAIQEELKGTLIALSPPLAWVAGDAASHVLVLLTRSSLAAGSASATALERAVGAHRAAAIVYVYLEPAAGEVGCRKQK